MAFKTNKKHTNAHTIRCTIKVYRNQIKTHQDEWESPFVLSALPTKWSSIYFSPL